MRFHDYEVCLDGRIWSWKTNKFLKPSSNGRGYQHIVLRVNGESRDYYLHRLVATAYVPNPDNLPEVNHKDGNKENNCFDNLEWVTSSENKKHAVRAGIKKEKGVYVILPNVFIY